MKILAKHSSRNNEERRTTSSEDESGSVSSNSKSKTISGRMKPTCGRCRVHGSKNVPLDKHKPVCPYRECKCALCYVFLANQRLSADKIALKRAQDTIKAKKYNPYEVLPTLPMFFTEHKGYGLLNLLMYTRNEINNSFPAWYSPTKVDQILSILIKYARDIDPRIKYDGHLDSAKICMYQAIHGSEIPFVTTLEQAACCYFRQPWVVRTPEKEQSGIRSCPLQNLPTWWSYNSLPVSATSTSPYPESSLKPPIEPSAEPFTDPSIEPPIEPSTEPPTDSFTDLSTESPIRSPIRSL